MSKSVFSALMVSTLVLSLSAHTLAAKPEGKGKDKPWKTQKNERSEQTDPLLRELTGAERDNLAELVLEKEYGFSKNSLPKGAAKQLPQGLKQKLQRGGKLPPGWQRKLQRGEVIDRETYSEAERLPDELLRRITGREDAVELLRVGDRILRVMEGRGTILDVVDLSDRAFRMLESN